jgi:hypothetical protein
VAHVEGRQVDSLLQGGRSDSVGKRDAADCHAAHAFGAALEHRIEHQATDRAGKAGAQGDRLAVVVVVGGPAGGQLQRRVGAADAVLLHRPLQPLDVGLIDAHRPSPLSC